MANIAQKSLLLLLFACSSVLVHAQAKLAVLSAWTVPADTVDWNGNSYYLEYRVIVTNVGNNVLTGPAKLYCSYNGDTIAWEKADFLLNTFEVGDTQLVAYTDTIEAINGAARHKGGDNIIVIWPKADNPNVQAPDTGQVDVYIRDLTLQIGSDPIELRNRIRIYPNPVGENLYLDYQRDAHKLEYVRVVNLAGQVMQHQNAAVSKLDFNGMPAGLYMVEVRYRDGVWGTYRVLHEN